jgi:hypothetical protein
LCVTKVKLNSKKYQKAYSHQWIFNVDLIGYVSKTQFL